MSRMIKIIRRTAEAVGYFTIAVLLLTALVSYINSDDRQAKSAGFDSSEDRKSALSAGVADPTAWKQQKADVAAKAEAAAKIEAETRAIAQQKQEQAEAAAAAKRQEEETKAAVEKQKREEAEAKKKEADCRADLRCWAEKGTVAAGIYCRDRIAKLAQYEMKWTDSWYEQKFSHFRWSRSAPKEMGVVTYLGDKAQFQNGFGAFQNVIYTCDMIPDDQNHTIFDVTVKAGRLD